MTKPSELIELVTGYLERIGELIGYFCDDMRKAKKCWRACPFGKSGNCISNNDGPLKLPCNLELLRTGVVKLKEMERNEGHVGVNSSFRWPK